MHSSDFMHTDPCPDHDNPHPNAPELFTVHHNGDFSGDVMIDLEGWRVEETQSADSQFARHGQPIYTVRVPFEVIAELVAQCVASRKISELESGNYKKILGL